MHTQIEAQYGTLSVASVEDLLIEELFVCGAAVHTEVQLARNLINQMNERRNEHAQLHTKRVCYVCYVFMMRLMLLK
jgi:hypothetical protein